MTLTPTAPSGTDAIRRDYLALTQRRRLYSGLLLLVFALLMIAGFRTAESRNAGGFIEGLAHLADFPAAILSEAWDKAANLPGHILDALPSLLETLNVAAVATLTGTMGGILLSLLATRGLAPCPRWPAFSAGSPMSCAPCQRSWWRWSLSFCWARAPFPPPSPSACTPRARWANCSPR